jgi:hypothetical protein
MPKGGWLGLVPMFKSRSNRLAVMENTELYMGFSRSRALKYRRSASRTSSDRVRCSAFIALSSSVAISGGSDIENTVVVRDMTTAASRQIRRPSRADILPI